MTISEKSLGVEHPETATSLNNLALLLQDQGDLAGARPLYERALAIFEKALGPEHPHTATSLNNLANLLQAQGDLTGARPLLERALAICEKTLVQSIPTPISRAAISQNFGFSKARQRKRSRWPKPRLRHMTGFSAPITLGRKNPPA